MPPDKDIFGKQLYINNIIDYSMQRRRAANAAGAAWALARLAMTSRGHFYSPSLLPRFITPTAPSNIERFQIHAINQPKC